MVRVVKFWDQESKVKSKSQCVKYLRSGWSKING